jgi:PEGA domain-containing protein
MPIHRFQTRAPRCCCWGAIFLTLLVALAICGCVQRRLTIRSNPPGARVYVGDEEIGTTPVSTDFVYYGTRKIRLVKDGFETLVVNQPIPAPWYQIPPFDFVAENLVPGEIRDERAVNFQLMPLQESPTQHLLSRAEQLRAGSGVQPFSVAVPAVPAAGSPAPAGGAAPVIVPPTGAAIAVPPPYNPPQYLPPG